MKINSVSAGSLNCCQHIDCRYKCITIMQKYNKTKVIRISETQLKTRKATNN